jgi:ABC-2 type transport system permease protein
MAVYERAYRTYTGGQTPLWSRFLVPAKYAFRNVFRSRLFLAFFVICFVPILAWSVWIYLFHNISALKILGTNAGALQQAMPIDGKFFLRVLYVQGWFAFFITMIVGPALVSPDLRNNALPLYLSRPFSRFEYVLSKMTVLAALLSLITWVPGLLLFLLQSYLEGWEWWSGNLRSAIAMLVGSWVWIVFLSLLALALSAWVKWKPVASMLFLGSMFFLSATGAAINAINDVAWGGLLQLFKVAQTIWQALFGVPVETDLSVLACWITLLLAGLIFAWMLRRKLRAYEVVS